jgi:hypothetical protein
MNVRRVADGIKQQAAGAWAWVYDAQVDAVDPARGTVSVTIQPHGMTVEGLNYFTPLTTGPWKAIHLPGPGATVKVISSDPTAVNADTAYAVAAQWDEDDTPPEGYAVGDVLWSHQAGGKVLLKANGDIEIFAGSIKLGDSVAVELCKKAVYDWLTSGEGHAFLTTHVHLDPLSAVTGPPDPVSLSLIAPGIIDGLTTKVKAT